MAGNLAPAIAPMGMGAVISYGRRKVDSGAAADGFDASTHLLWARNFQYDAFRNNW